MSFSLILFNLLGIAQSQTDLSETKTINGQIIYLDFGRKMLDKHNELRNDLALNGIPSSGQPSATYMNKLMWDDGLAALAQSFTDKCNIGHNSNRIGDLENKGFMDYTNFEMTPSDSCCGLYRIGENYLNYPRRDDEYDSLIDDYVQYAYEKWWEREHNEYTYSTDRCSGVCGHYG